MCKRGGRLQLHSNVHVCMTNIAYVISRMHKQTNRQTDKHGKYKAILGPAVRVRPAGKNIHALY